MSKPDKILKAGGLSAELWGADLRHVKFGGREIIQRLYVAVRTENWSTVPAKVESLVYQDTPDGFVATFRVRHEDFFYWQATITGWKNGRIKFEMSGEILKDFRRNRIGICCLHPFQGCEEFKITHTEGAISTGVFEELVNPGAPAKDIHLLTFKFPTGEALLQFDGDVFEMEDQRNWTDASFKTYSTPADRPRPVLVTAGTKIVQSVMITASGQPAAEEFASSQAKRTAPFASPGGVGGSLILNNEVVIVTPGSNFDAATAAGPDPLYVLAENFDPEAIAERWPMAMRFLWRKNHFVDLNRNRPNMLGWHGAAVAVHPQVHAVGDQDILDNSGALGEVVQTVRHFAGRAAIAPLTLGPNWNSSTDPRRGSMVEALYFASAAMKANQAEFIAVEEPIGLFREWLLSGASGQNYIVNLHWQPRAFDLDPFVQTEFLDCLTQVGWSKLPVHKGRRVLAPAFSLIKLLA